MSSFPKSASRSPHNLRVGKQQFSAALRSPFSFSQIRTLVSSLFANTTHVNSSSSRYHRNTILIIFP
eukprot:scaffold24543_cov195-Amphora_coffeaeformis.AAC.20